ncbi:MAG TPA: hypothetical protein VKS60_19575, partial [Stellaceae bacterium]|nr:hypothetical protein [Stellaceae bacterium]
ISSAKTSRAAAVKASMALRTGSESTASSIARSSLWDGIDPSVPHPGTEGCVVPSGVHYRF